MYPTKKKLMACKLIPGYTAGDAGNVAVILNGGVDVQNATGLLTSETQETQG